jgi:hypothetical protein
MAMVPDHSPSDYDIKNMLRRSRINPKLSAFTQIFGVFDYNRTPLAPIGTKTVVHQRTTQQGRTTFADHGVIGWSIGPAMNHYRHWTFYIPKTRGTRVSDTVSFLQENYTMPATASSDRATAAIEELTEALKNPSESAKPFLNTGSKLNEAITALTELSAMNRPTGTKTKTSVILPGQRTTTKEPVKKRTTTPQVFVSPTTNITPLQMPINPQLAHHRGTRGLSLNSFNSTNNIKKGTISSKNRTKNIIDTQRKENSPQNAPIRSPINNQNINDTNTNIINTQRQENSPHAPIRRKLQTRATQKKQGYICGFDTKEVYYTIKYQDGDIEEATEEEIDRMIRKPNKTAMARALSATRFD